MEMSVLPGIPVCKRMHNKFNNCAFGMEWAHKIDKLCATEKVRACWTVNGTDFAAFFSHFRCELILIYSLRGDASFIGYSLGDQRD